AGPVWFLSRLRQLVPLSLTAANDEAIYFVKQNHGWDDSATRQAFGLVPRPLEVTLADTLRWMGAAGHVSPAAIGRLAAELSPQKA
ncbi:MAG TPA: hypothetical protein VGW38_18550, partial [Chloroflexota bacterium]|nr:hypothetical protein [Chloroflexota bacterium]